MSEEVDKNDIPCYTSERRATIVSFSKNKDEISIQDEEEEKENIETYLDHSGERFECCGICLPVPFERASRKSWWDPRFDSEILEGQYRQSAFSKIRLRFRYSMVYMLFLSLTWCAYLIGFGILDKSQKDAFPLGVIFFLFAIFCIINLIFTKSPLYRRYQLPVSIVISVAMCLLSLASVCTSPVLSPAGDFAICVEILMIIYTVIPLPLYLCVILGVLYSVCFEVFGSEFALPVRILSHCCVHLIALHILIMTNVRMRGTFMKVGQSLLVRKQLEREKKLKEKMIHSVMPPKVANWLMSEGGGNYDERNPSGGDIKSLFRPFNMNSTKDVSILFADIVGFTKMSSNKKASELVAVLNELFERFDHLCTKSGCEKIATLGDCYYCVSGCPTPRPDHAHCCVRMGLGMIEAIAEFDEEWNEDVNMRVGVHTGTVLCGIVGTRRFKFDVWSNDVTLANKMESTGKPGRVHISQSTKNFLDDMYLLEPGDVVHDIETYFIVSPKENIPSQASSNQMTITSATPTVPSEPSTQLLSFETALTGPQTHSNSQSLTTAISQPSQTLLPRKYHSSTVHCTVSPFDKLKDSEIFGDNKGDRAFSTPSSPTPLQARTSHALPRLKYLRLYEVKATSLPSVFTKDVQLKPYSRTSLVGSAVLGSNKKISPIWKYSRLKISKTETENGKVQQTFKSPSLLSDPLSIEKAMSNQLEVPHDELSMCHSVNSRKDSGIKSNSRRSSIQQQIFAINGIAHGELLAQRVSGYYTSSQSSVNDTEKGVSKIPKLPAPFSDSLIHYQNLRKQSDLQLIKCVQDNSRLESSSFAKSPLRMWSLRFREKELEREYREKAHRTSPDETDKSYTLATARFNTYFDIIISLIVFTSLSISSFIIFPLSIPWVTVFVILLLVQITVSSLCIRSIFNPTIIPRFLPLLRWYPWHAVGALLVSLPIIVVLINFDKSTVTKDYFYNYSYLFFVGLVHYCNFTQLNCWMKSLLATLGALIYLILITSALFSHPEILNGNVTDLSEPLLNVPDAFNHFRIADIDSVARKDFEPDGNDRKFKRDAPFEERTRREIELVPMARDNDTVVSNTRSKVSRSDSFLLEIFLDIFLLVLLVWLLNREFEISYRLSFRGNAVAAKDQSKVEFMKNQADWLLHNIIPRHVVDQLKTTARYSENVKDAGILFASIVNFSEMYDESYLGGRECLRVLNELVADFDELLGQPQFSMVEKIKTIGSTFMAASGLNSSQRDSESMEHLFQLMEFALALQSAIDNFNADLLEFDLVLRVGYNYGDVTAGVIGTTKLHYDIWGDPVNIASRMDSTGKLNRIQVPEHCIEVLSQRYTFERRGTIYVKGKDNMDVYLVSGTKELEEQTQL